MTSSRCVTAVWACSTSTINKFDDARTELTQAVQLATSPDPVDYYLLGNADAQASYMNGAIAAYDKCAATGPARRPSARLARKP